MAETKGVTSRAFTLAKIGGSLFATILSQQLKASDVGAYAVANHSACGAGNIPGTIRELDKFFASPNLTSNLQKNFYWKDARVRQFEWLKDNDYKTSGDSSNGFDGADASLLTYIASHGVTSGGIYRALAGSKGDGGCYIPTTSLELGNHRSRYLILSTCQGLKIGTGDNPASPSGENPSRTWKNAAKGLNCILGYSNNMADADEYGDYLLANLKDGNDSLAKAFMDASESVSQDNIPAVMCFGATDKDASDFITNNRTFNPAQQSSATSAWVYRQINQLQQPAPLTIPHAVRIHPKNVNPKKVASAFLGKRLSKSKMNSQISFTSENGSATYQQSSGILTIKNALVPDLQSQATPSESESYEIAQHALKIGGLDKLAGPIVLSAIATEYLGSQDQPQKILSRKFSFSQVLRGTTPLSEMGTVQVTVGSGGAVSEIKSALVEADSKFNAETKPTQIASRIEALEKIALEQVASKAPGASYSVEKRRIGFDIGDFHHSNEFAPAVIELTITAAQGEFKRNFIEKIAL